MVTENHQKRQVADIFHSGPISANFMFFSNEPHSVFPLDTF
jgi:hypothetical protein